MRKLLFALLFVLIFGVSAAIAGEETIEFGWNQAISPDFAGWKVYKSEMAGGPYIYVTDIAYETEQSEYTSEQVIIAPDGQTTTFHFVFTAFDIKGNESGYSNEVSREFDFEAPDNPFSLTIKISSG